MLIRTKSLKFTREAKEVLGQPEFIYSKKEEKEDASESGKKREVFHFHEKTSFIEADNSSHAKEFLSLSLCITS